mmetsp:Transcript_28860/g.72629  ORF Transcript_28860/g.72629 Transcript_28860/m.72629 type:complete len:295 (+) Transcript_28860:526-1410(+)
MQACTRSVLDRGTVRWPLCSAEAKRQSSTTQPVGTPVECLPLIALDDRVLLHRNAQAQRHLVVPPSGIARPRHSTQALGVDARDPCGRGEGGEGSLWCDAQRRADGLSGWRPLGLLCQARTRPTPGGDARRHPGKHAPAGRLVAGQQGVGGLSVATLRPLSQGRRSRAAVARGASTHERTQALGRAAHQLRLALLRRQVPLGLLALVRQAAAQLCSQAAHGLHQRARTHDPARVRRRSHDLVRGLRAAVRWLRSRNGHSHLSRTGGAECALGSSGCTRRERTQGDHGQLCGAIP